MSPFLPWCLLACQSLCQWEHMTPRWVSSSTCQLSQQTRHHHICFLVFLFGFLFWGPHLALLGGSSQFSTEKLFWAAHLCGILVGTQISFMQLMQPSIWAVLTNFFSVLQRIYECGLMNYQLSQIKWSFSNWRHQRVLSLPSAVKISGNHRRKDFDFCLPLSTSVKLYPYRASVSLSVHCSNLYGKSDFIWMVHL